MRTCLYYFRTRMVKYNFPEHYSDSAWSAIELAKELKATGKFDLFRGQRHTYPIQPTAFRNGVDTNDVIDNLDKFQSWVNQTPDLSSLVNDTDAFFAVAQHYGFATPLLDFSYSPLVAGFFATDSAVDGDTGTIICVNKESFISSWKDINKRNFEKEGRVLTEIVEIDVKNLWRLQAQEGLFLKCHVDPTYLEMFSSFLHIYFPQEPGLSVLKREKVYPNVKSHIEVLLDQYFLIDSYGARKKELEENYRLIANITNEGVASEISEYFIDNKLPEDHESWKSDYALSWYLEPDEKFAEKWEHQQETLFLGESDSCEELEDRLITEILRVLRCDDIKQRKCIKWSVVTENNDTWYVGLGGSLTPKKDQHAKFKASDMVNVIYDGMRYLPYTNNHIALAIARYLTMMTFGINQVIDDTESVDISGGFIRGRAICSKRKVQRALRDDLYDFIKNEYHDPDKMDFRDLLYISYFVKRSYVFGRFIDLFVEDLIPSQAAIAIEGLVVGLNPIKIDVMGES